LRHTYASWLHEAGVDLYTISKLVGHANITMTQRYSHVADTTLENAVNALQRDMERKAKGKGRQEAE
jgi:site-specific recombinase XerD